MAMHTRKQIADGLQALQRRDLARAEACFAAVLAYVPREPDALHFMGAVRQMQGDMREAERLFRAASEAAPHDGAVHNSLGSLFNSLGRLEEALVCFDRALMSAPGLAQAAFNRVVVLQKLGLHEEAVEALGGMAGSAAVLNARGLSLKELGRMAEAETAFQEALVLEPGYFRAAHNLGNLRCANGQTAEAIPLYAAAIRQAPKHPELRFALASALYDTGDHEGADREFRTAIALKPDYWEAHDALNHLYWQHGKRELYGKSYRMCTDAAPASAPLRVAHIKALEQAGRLPEAVEVADAALFALGEMPELLHRRARLRLALGDADAGLADYASAVRHADDSAVAVIRLDRAKALTRLGVYDDALADLAAVETVTPFDQELWAYRGLCWRLKGDARAEWLNDYERLVRPAFIDVPDGYTSLEDFLGALKATLLELHARTGQPVDQTLRGGSQTNGALLSRQEPVLKALRSALKAKVTDYISALPDDDRHPLLSRKGAGFTFSGSWSVLLRPNGFHVNHVHPRGWISSAFYVDVPEYDGEMPHAGTIKFGESGAGLGPDRELVARRIRPEPGLLALFPSYMWHGTEAFTKGAARITTPFDIIPA
jgi:tetratricopeptide (TPR) repeat protein